MSCLSASSIKLLFDETETSAAAIKTNNKEQQQQLCINKRLQIHKKPQEQER